MTAKSGKLLWHCNRQPADKPACTQDELTAAIAHEVPSHFPVPGRKPRRRSDQQIVAELTAMLDKPMNGNGYRLQAAMLLLELDSKAAAERLKIPERTRRRLLCP